VKGRKPTSIVASSSAVAEVPRPPAWLSKAAKVEWRRVAPILVARNVLEEADLATLAGYASAVGQVIEAEAILAREGLTYMGASGPKRHPACAIKSDGLNQMRLLGGQFGLNPVDRSRPSIREGADDEGEDLGL